MHLREVFLLDAFISKAHSLYKPRQGVLPSLDKVTHVEAITHFISLSSNPLTQQAEPPHTPQLEQTS